MLRTVPETIDSEIDLYIRTYYSLLRSTEPIKVRSLEDSYAGTGASLHPNAGSGKVDMSAFTYAVARLPACMHKVDMVILGQSYEAFTKRAALDLSSWVRVSAAARRRKMYYDGKDRLACYVSSVSDIDDIIPVLTAFQIEWNKIRLSCLQKGCGRALGASDASSAEKLAVLRRELDLDTSELERLRSAWGDELDSFLSSLAGREMDIKIHLLAGSLADYRQAVQSWWKGIEESVGPLSGRRVYFVSSNPHALPNLLSGYACSIESELIDFLHESNPESLLDEWSRLSNADGEEVEGRRRNFLYYIQRYYMADSERQWQRKLAYLLERGIHSISRTRYLDIGVQVIEMNKLKPEDFDPRIRIPGLDALSQSDALIFNIDYPLGMAAYHVFAQLSASVPLILGVYIMGKAASLNGRVGDIMLPNVVYDEHSKNTYLFKNCFSASDVAPFLRFGTVFDNQKAITVRGTLLQNIGFMDVAYKEGYTDIEMEAGPYLSAIYEDIYPQRFPVNEIVNLFINAPYDIGLIHYTSDTPYSRHQSLLSKSLSYFGVDGTYAAMAAITRRILQAELDRLTWQ